MYQVRYGAKPTVEEIATLKDAVERAGQLISDNYANVTVRDGEGNEISGDDLLACYLGVTTLTSDLRVVDEHSPSRVMEISKEDFERLRQLEESLWRAERRFDREYMDATLAPDFFEFGRSGRVYRREDALNVESSAIQATLPLPQFAARLIAGDVALVTYMSEVTYGNTLERANRSSLWSRYPMGWRLRFHQGTPA